MAMSPCRTLVVQDQAAHLVHAPHPLLPIADRRVIHTPVIAGERVGHYLARHGLLYTLPDSMVTYNGALIDAAAIWRIRLGPDDLIAVIGTVQGGGDNSGAKVARTVLTIAAIYFSGGAAMTLLGADVATESALTYAITKGLIAAGGVMLVNALIPPPAIDIPTIAQAKRQETSPSYSIGGGQNRARLYQPMPVVIGRHRIFPDLSTRPYTEFNGDDQILNTAFNFGLSDLVITQEKIGDTPLGAFGIGNVARQRSNASGVLVYAPPSNVDTLAGQVLVAGTAIIRTSSIDAVQIGIDITGSLFYSGSSGPEPRAVTIQIRYKQVSQGAWVPVTFKKNVTGTVYSRGTPGLIHYSIDTAEATPGQVRITHSKRTPFRRTYTFDVAPGQYDIEVTRITAAETDPRAVSNVTFTQIKTYQPDRTDYSGQTRVSLRMKASATLNGGINQYNAIASARCAVWNGIGWQVQQETSNPAWWFRWFAIGLFDVNGKRILGVGLPTARVDEAKIKAWGAWCDTKGLQCNFIIDQATTAADVMSTIARCGRAGVTWANGKLGVMWDADNQLITARFGMSNIIAGTFRVEYASGKVADEIVATWINPAIGWQPDTVRAAVPGVVNPINPAQVTLFGVTHEQQAGRAALLLAAEQSYRRRRIIWETDIEGLAVNRGDVVGLSHDLTQWGDSGRIVAGNNWVISLDKTVNYDPAKSYHLGIRRPDGTFFVAALDNPGYAIDKANMSGLMSPSIDSDTAHQPMDYLWFLSTTGEPAKKVKITDIEPLSVSRVRITAVDEEPLFYAAETNPYTYTTPGLPGVTFPNMSSLVVADTTTRVGMGFAVIATASWAASGDYAGAWVRIRKPNEAWRLLGSTTATEMEFTTEPTGQIEVQVVGFNRRGQSNDASTLSALYTIVGQSAPPPDVDAFFFSGQADGTRQFDWQLSQIPADLDGYVIRYAVGLGQAISAMVPLHTGVLKASPFETNLLGAGDYSFAIEVVDTSGNRSLNPRRIDATLSAPRIAGAIDTIDAQAQGWPGTITQAVQQGGSLVAADQQTWDGLGATTWDAWVAWTGAPYASFTYQHPDYAIGVLAHFKPIATATGHGAIVIDEQHSTDNVTWSAWAASGPSITAKYVRFRATVTAGVGIAQLDQLQIILSAKAIAEELIDLDTATLTGAQRIAVGHIKLPISKPFAAIARLSVALQNVTGAGWWWEVISKADVVNGPEIKIHTLVNGVDTLADAVIDAYITGV